MSLLRWWIVFLVVAIGAHIAILNGWVKKITDADPTGISWAIIAIFAVMTLYNGVLTANLERKGSNPKELQRKISNGSIAATSCSRLGLIGTVVGFITQVASLGALDATNVAGLQSAIAHMSEGIGIALYTTLLGQLAALLLILQYHMLERAIEERCEK